MHAGRPPELEGGSVTLGRDVRDTAFFCNGRFLATALPFTHDGRQLSHARWSGVIPAGRMRGLETMGVRLAHMGRVSTDFATKLQEIPAVARVLHPALPSCPGHEFWKRDFNGASGVFSVVLKPGYEGNLDAAMTAMKTFAIGASWGGTRSLLVPMSIASDRVVTPWTEKGAILRISIGLEDPEDLWDDLETLFATLTVDGVPA